MVAALALVALIGTSTVQAGAPLIALEIRSYTLKAGSRARFHELFERQSLPLLRRFGVDVVAYGPSGHDDVSYFLIRSFPGLTDRERTEDAFYGSPEWREGPRDEVLDAIETYTTVVVQVDSSTLEGVRRIMTQTSTAADIETLSRLNEDYLESVRTSNVARFREILAADFLCTQPDGTLLDLDQFLAQVAKPYTLTGLTAHDLHIRVLGDIALVHARTTFGLPSGTAGSGRYTDVWARRNGRWVAIAAHVTRR